ncbi:hypothetical protein GP486_002725 [Trichoglossum hirsutum]|uniref:Uncharacterized protein n=1 Tax=Trichoglossum hirsutum TaxID=265104 RepID=A0A9P8RRU8_9PEZI|nr:hypothetical protein GP486_002725 [Trichoglossum hirsutum]
MNSSHNPNPARASPTVPQQPQQQYSFYGSNQPAPSPNTPHGNGSYGAPDYSAWGYSQNDVQMTEPARGEITWLAPKPVGRPLSAAFSLSEAEESLPPPWPEESGNSVSKYFNLKSLSEACVTIRDAEDWEYMKDDPIFQRIGDGDLIPISELIASRGRSRQRGTDQNESRESPIPSDHGGNKSDQPGWSVMDNLENALNSGDFTAVSTKQKQVKSEPFDMAETEQLDRVEESTQRKLVQDVLVEQRKTSVTSDESQEEKLARLGVTGAPKPVTSRDRGGSRRRSRSPTYDRRTHANRHQGYRERDALRSHVGKPSISRQNSHGSGDCFAGSARTNDRHSPQQQHGYAYHGIHPAPPPPPPPLPVHTYRGTDNCSPSSSHENAHRASRGSSETLNDNQPISGGRRSASPSGSRSKGLGGGGREYRERDRLGERRDEPQRQPDDLAAKRKRSQPQVADAYR